MAGVEFVIDDDGSDGSDAPPDASSRRRHPHVVITGLWLAAAAPAAVSATLDVYTYAFRGGIINVRGGWTADGKGLDTNLLSDRSPQFSLPIWGCAAIFVAVGLGWALARDRRLAERGQLAGVAAAGALLATLVLMVLWMQSSIANVSSVAAPLRSSGGGDVHVTLGPSPFVLGAAVLLATAASIVPFAANRTRRRREAPDEPIVADITVVTREDLSPT